MEHIVLTGVGMMSAAGTGAGPVLDAMASGTHFFNVEHPGKRSLHPRFPWPEASLKEPNVPWPEGGAWPDIKKYANDSAHQAVAVGRMAIAQSGMADEASAIRCGAVMASGNRSDELAPLMGRLGLLAQTDPRPLAKLLFDEVPDYSYLRGIPCQIGQFVCLATGFRGSNVAHYGEAGASGLGALSFAKRMLEHEELDRVIVVGVGIPLPPQMLVALDRHNPLGTEAIPGRGPFDVGRAGTLLGHAAVALIIERESVARARGAATLGTLLLCESINATSSPAALAVATQRALEFAGRPPQFWWAHGAGSVSADLAECQTVAPLVRGPTTGTKGTIGNTGEAAGLVDVVLAAEALRRGQIPPVGLLQKPDPALGDIDFVVGKPRAMPPGRGTALVTALDSRAECAGAAVIGM